MAAGSIRLLDTSSYLPDTGDASNQLEELAGRVGRASEELGRSWKKKSEEEETGTTRGTDPSGG
jgi:hypothetical protein